LNCRNQRLHGNRTIRITSCLLTFLLCSYASIEVTFFVFASKGEFQIICMFLIEIHKCQEIKHGCPKQPDVDCKELMNVNTWEATKCILTCRLFENFPGKEPAATYQANCNRLKCTKITTAGIHLVVWIELKLLV